MAKSVAKKYREHLERQGKHNPSESRGTWWGVNPLTKTTPTKQGKQQRLENKHKVNLFNG